MEDNSQAPKDAIEVAAAHEQGQAEGAAETETTIEAAAVVETPVVEAAPAAEAGKESGEDFAQMLDESEKKAAGEVKVGDKVSGVIAKIDGENAFVDFGGRGEGLIRTSELMGKDGELLLKVGDPIEAFASSVGDEVVLSSVVSRAEGNTDALYQAYKSGMPVEGQVDAVNKWGMGVIFQGGVRGFCPISQIETTFVESAEEYRGKTFSFKIIEFRHQGRDIVVSRRALMEVDQNKDAEVVRGKLVKGARLKGEIVRLETFGAFVALGSGVEGLIHVSEISHQRVEKPEDVLAKGQEVEVIVLGTKSLGNRRKERISLSIKSLDGNPWDDIRKNYPAGSIVEGKVDSLEDYGAFIEVAEGVRGMVHVSEIADRRIGHPREELSVGDALRVVVLEVDPRRQRLRLSIRKVETMESATNLRDFQARMQKEKTEEPSGNALTDALRRAKLAG
ncbi:MAG: 30S ribosomal protein S1 [Candidatus Latescibacterota bacterium]|jgi:small subunit ribosomal protein S1